MKEWIDNLPAVKKAEIELKAAKWLKSKGYDRKSWNSIAKIIAEYEFENQENKQLKERNRRLIEIAKKYKEDRFQLARMTPENTEMHNDLMYQVNEIEQLLKDLEPTKEE